MEQDLVEKYKTCAIMARVATDALVSPDWLSLEDSEITESYIELSRLLTALGSKCSNKARYIEEFIKQEESKITPAPSKMDKLREFLHIKK